MLVRPLAPRLGRPAILLDRRRWSTDGRDGDAFMVFVFCSVGVRCGGAQASSSFEIIGVLVLIVASNAGMLRGHVIGGWRGDF